MSDQPKHTLSFVPLKFKKNKQTKESIFTAEGIVSLWATLTTDMELYVSSYRRCTYFQLSFAFFDFERMFFKTLTKGQQKS